MASPGSLLCVLTATEVSQATGPSPEGVLPLLLPGPENLSTLVSRVFLLRAELCSWVSPQQGAPSSLLSALHASKCPPGLGVVN